MISFYSQNRDVMTLTEWLEAKAETLREWADGVEGTEYDLLTRWRSLADLIDGTLADHDHVTLSHATCDLAVAKAYWSGCVEGSVKALRLLATHVAAVTGSEMPS